MVARLILPTPAILALAEGFKLIGATYGLIRLACAWLRGWRHCTAPDAGAIEPKLARAHMRRYCRRRSRRLDWRADLGYGHWDQQHGTASDDCGDCRCRCTARHLPLFPATQALGRNPRRRGARFAAKNRVGITHHGRGVVSTGDNFSTTQP